MRHRGIFELVDIDNGGDGDYTANDGDAGGPFTPNSAGILPTGSPRIAATTRIPNQ